MHFLIEVCSFWPLADLKNGTRGRFLSQDFDLGEIQMLGSTHIFLSSTILCKKS